ncbi:MAG: AAA family ATPase [Thermoleophilia bacterium]
MDRSSIARDDDAASDRSLAVAVVASRAAEEACLGAALVNSAAAVLLSRDLDGSDFRAELHRRIYTAIAALCGRGAGVDLLTVASEVEQTVGWTDDSGRDYLHLLAEGTFTAANQPEYIALVKQQARERTLKAHLQCAVLAAQVTPLSAAARVKLGAEITAAKSLLEAADGDGRDALQLAFLAAPDLAATEDVEIDWIVADYLAAGATTQLTGQPKAGKSLFAMCLANAVASGREFMGRQTKQGTVVYLSEQTVATFKSSARATGLLANPHVIVLPRSRVWQHDWATIIAAAIAYCREVGAVLLIVDTVGRWASLAGDQENDSGAALATMQPLEEAAAAGLAVLAIRHERKNPGADVVDAGRGSSAFAGAFDQLLSLKKAGGQGHDNRRRLLAEGRFDETPHELVIDYADGIYTARGSGLDVERSEVSAAVLALLPDSASEAWTLDELLAACNQETETTKPTLVRVLGTEEDHGLVGTGQVERAKGVGSASARAYGYWREVEP